jgi:hypothetical protein
MSTHSPGPWTTEPAPPARVQLQRICDARGHEIALIAWNNPDDMRAILQAGEMEDLIRDLWQCEKTGEVRPSLRRRLRAMVERLDRPGP